jgi:hypothetical protein
MRQLTLTNLLLMLIAALIAIEISMQPTAASDVFRITSGLISANETELKECYFPIAQESSVNFKPGSTPCDLMKPLNGKKVDLWFTVVE